MPLLGRKRVLGMKVEATPGTAESITTSEETIIAYDPVIQTDIKFDDRPSQGSFGHYTSVAGALGGIATFKTSLVGYQSAVPKWATVLLAGCRFGTSSLVVSPSSQAPGSTVKTLTIACYIDGVRKILRGCAGNAFFNFVAGELIWIDWKFMGIWVTPTDVSLPVPTVTTDSPLKFTCSTAMTLDPGTPWSPKVSKMTLDLGNNVIMRHDGGATDGSGYAHAMVTNSKIVGTMDPEAVLVATNANYTQLVAGTTSAWAFSLGTGANKIDFAAPKLQFTKLTEGDRNGLTTDEMEFQLCKSADAGDDELTLTFHSS